MPGRPDPSNRDVTATGPTACETYIKGQTQASPRLAKLCKLATQNYICPHCTLTDSHQQRTSCENSPEPRKQKQSMVEPQPNMRDLL